MSSLAEIKSLVESVVEDYVKSKRSVSSLSDYPPPDYADQIGAIGGHREKDQHMAGLKADVDQAKKKNAKPEKNDRSDEKDLLNDVCEEDQIMAEIEQLLSDE